ncbi:MAG: response regulator transcription factor [Bacteroidales bacterium]|nr:response regulator transcription factor [Bacteroidales bacterium]
MNVVIIEDEKFAADHLEKMILKYDPNVAIMAKLESVAESIDWFQQNPEPDLIFLDIHLEDGLSFTIFESIKINAPIIFTTAFDEYAIKAFKLRSIDYLLKPILQDDLNNALEKYQEMHFPKNAPFDMAALMDIISHQTPQNEQAPYRERFSVTIGSRIKSITIQQIAYFFSEEGITFLITNDNTQYPIDYSLEQLTKMLDPNDFFRINRQFMVKHEAIKNIHVFPKSRLKLDLQPACEHEAFVSIDKVTKFKLWLGQ